MPEKNDKPKFRINISPDLLRKKLNAQETGDRRIFADVARHSRDYLDALQLSHEDLEDLQRLQGHINGWPTPEQLAQTAQITVGVDDVNFYIFTKKTACHDYGGDWQDLLMAVSERPDLNEAIGHGTGMITKIPDEWHQKVVQAISQSGNTDLSGELFGFLTSAT